MSLQNPLLVLACSRRKRPSAALLPAVERYDGPTFRVLRRYVRASGPAPATWIISAEFGLIPADWPVPDYDRAMTPARAALLRPQVEEALGSLARERHDGALVCAGRAYAPALGDLGAALDCPVTLVAGPPGRQGAALKDWLNGSPSEAPAAEVGGPVRFRGRVVTSTPDQVLRLARERAAEDPAGASRFESWFVPVGDLRVAPKWLVSLLTGEPPRAFRTADALRVLAQLGVGVHRV